MRWAAQRVPSGPRLRWRRKDLRRFVVARLCPQAAMPLSSPSFSDLVDFDREDTGAGLDEDDDAECGE